MVRLKNLSKYVFGSLCVLTLAHATEISDRFAVISSFKDDRYVNSLNDNFRRITQTFVADGDFNVPVIGTSTIIKLNAAQTDADYGIFIQAAFASSMTAVMNKTVDSFKVEYSTPGNAPSTLDWILVR